MKKIIIQLILSAGMLLYTAFPVLAQMNNSFVYSQQTVTTGKLSIKDNPFKYSGYCQDEESGNYYLKARYYNPTLKRFTSRDSYDLNNKYAYCKNDPFNRVDPDGHMSEGLSLSLTVIIVAAEISGCALTAGSGAGALLVAAQAASSGMTTANLIFMNCAKNCSGHAKESALITASIGAALSLSCGGFNYAAVAANKVNGNMASEAYKALINGQEISTESSNLEELVLKRKTLRQTYLYYKNNVNIIAEQEADRGSETTAGGVCTVECSLSPEASSPYEILPREESGPVPLDEAAAITAESIKNNFKTAQTTLNEAIASKTTGRNIYAIMGSTVAGAAIGTGVDVMINSMLGNGKNTEGQIVEH